MLPNLDKWLAHFRRCEPEQIDWTLPAWLNDDERAAIAQSLAIFQLGEQSEGRGLMKHAREYACQHEDLRLLEITRCFIREEQYHASILKQFMQEAGIPLVTRNWTDTIFRRLRKNVGYELSITVLVTAEIIALTYYRALYHATENLLLRQICTRILSDEQAHVEYEALLINHFRRSGTGWRKKTLPVLHRLLFVGALAVVGLHHHQVLQRSGFSTRQFWGSCMADFDRLFS